MKKLLFILIPVIIVSVILAFFLIPDNVAVITYHDFVEGNPENNMQINIDKFEEEMRFLKDHNYKTLEMKDIECYLENECKLPKKSVLITIDDGWINSYKLAIPILEKYNLKATIFYIGGNGENENFMSLDEIKDIKENHKNITIASHTYGMHYETAYLNDYETLDKDFKKMNEILDTRYFAYPYGLKSDTYKDVLKANNYSLAFTFGPSKEHRKLTKKDNRFELPRLNFSTNVSLWKFKLRLFWPF